MTLPLETMARLFRFSTDQALDPMLWMDAGGTLYYANEAAGRVLGYEPRAIMARRFSDLAVEMSPDLWRELWKEIRSHGHFSFEFALRAEGSRSIDVDMTIHHTEAEGCEYACVFFRDVGEKQRLKHLEQEFVSTVSHELRTPLTVIREGVSQVAEGLRGEINDLQRRALDLALMGIERLGRIIDELLDLSKIEAGKVSLNRERMDAAVVAREVVAEFQAVAEDRQIDLRVSTPAGPVVLFADRDRLIQVLSNLLHNAFKFTEKGRIELRIEAQENAVSCSVTDTGVGMGAEETERIFDKFEQLGRTTVTGEKGTGLGLSITRALVELHKGRIRAESAGPGQGSRFVVELPRLGAQEVFREKIARSLQEVAVRGGSLSVVIFDIEVLGREPLEEACIASALDGLEDMVRKNSGRRTDILVKGKRTVYVALPSTVKREANRVVERILRTFDENIVRMRLSGRLRMHYTLTGYPDDAADDELFLEKTFPAEAA